MTLRLAVLGDSIAWGQGASRESERLAPRLVEGLERHGHEVELRVCAVPGARSADLAGQVDSVLTWEPDVVVVVIGANDLTHLEPLQPAVHALARAVRRLRNAGAEVVVAPAPDLSAVPHVPVFLREIVQAASRQLRERQAEAVVVQGGHLGDPEQRTTRAFAADGSLFSADRFHPSSAGYAVIADSLLPTVLDAVRAQRSGRP